MNRSVTKHRAFHRSWVLFLIACLMVSLLSGCKSEIGEAAIDAMLGDPSGKDSVSEEEELQEDETVEAESPLEEAEALNGEAHRPYAFMLNNFSIAMPLCGISEADLVFEMLDENTVTRMMALFFHPETAGTVGSIRTARTTNVELALGYDAILVHMAESEEAQSMINAYGLAVLDAASSNAFDSGTFYWDTDRQSHGEEHSLFAVGGKCVSSAEGMLSFRTEFKEGYSSNYGVEITDEAGSQCKESAETIQVVYPGGKISAFEYDDELMQYRMYQYGAELQDNGEISLPFSNVVVIFAGTYLMEETNEYSIELTEGNGYYFCEGKAAEIHWYKDGVYDTLHFELEDGTELQFKDGKTFIAINSFGEFQGSVDYE